MANTVSNEVRDQIREAFLMAKGIKAISRDFGVGRNTVRRHIRSEGLVPPQPQPHLEESRSLRDLSLETATTGDYRALDFSFLEKLFKMAGPGTENLEFQAHIKKLVTEIADEIGVQASPLDQVRIELAMAEFINYRRFYLRSLAASDARYEGPFSKSHDKLARTTLNWAKAAQIALDNFFAIIRDLEIKYRKRFVTPNSITAIQINS